MERPRRRPRRRAGRRRAGALLALPGAARAAGRRRRHHGPLRPAPAGQAPGARAGAGVAWTGRCSRRSSGRRRSPRCSAPGSTPTPSSCTRPSAAGSSRRCSRSAGRPRTWPATSTARRTRSSCDQDDWQLRDYQQRGGGQLLGRRLGRRRAALRRRQDAGRRGGDGRGEGDHADPGHQHGRRPAVEARAARPHRADRGGDRRVLRRAQGDPPGHHRDVPGDDHPAEGRVPAPGAVRQPGLGPDRLRRGAPAAGADLPADRRPAVPPPARADRDAGPRGRPGGRRLLADRPEALRRAVEGHRGAGLHRPGRVHRGAGDADRRRADDVRRRRAGGALQGRGDRPHQAAGGRSAWSSGTPASRCW